MHLYVIPSVNVMKQVTVETEFFSLKVVSTGYYWSCLKTMVLTRLANLSSTPKVALVVYASIMLSIMGSPCLVRSVLEQ